ncbi:MAG: TetR/AcrR family transcriptional regulator [Muribaculaceae bacterium]|nr:TetR/AcrR family transcriptional regulator [Bacteroides sp.]MDE7496165.1 TetR/AcrR family transcriptional regulator [Muribaculaceae bacterium]
MVSKTRDKFIEVARQLFARKGVENTTMNDIASASDKGRRTIYTYFKSKRDIFNAVIERETDQLLNKLRIIVAKPISPEEKFYEYVNCRFETMKEIVSRNGSLRAGFFRDVRKVDRARKIISKKEISMLYDILEEGVQQGVFEIDDMSRTAVIITHAIHGLDVPYIRDNLADQGIDKDMLSNYIATILLNGIKRST